MPPGALEYRKNAEMMPPAAREYRKNAEMMPPGEREHRKNAEMMALTTSRNPATQAVDSWARQL